MDTDTDKDEDKGKHQDLLIVDPFKRILQSDILRSKLFKYVNDIHYQLASYSHIRTCDYYDLGCYPDMLISLNYIPRYKNIFNTLILGNNNNNNNNNSCSNNNNSNIENKNNNKNIEDVDMISLNKFKKLFLKSFRTALKLGSMEVVELLHSSLPIDYKLVLSKLDYETNFSVEIVEFLHRNADLRGRGETSLIMDNAARCGNIDVVQFLHGLGTSVSCTARAMNSAARFGFIDIVKFLHENRTEGCTKDAMDSAAATGSLEVVQFLHNNRTEGCTKYAFNNAARYGHLDILKFLLENRSEGCPDGIAESATSRGQLDIIKFLVEQRKQEIGTNAMVSAVWFGYFDVVKYLHENTTAKCTTDAMDQASCDGYLDIVEFLHFHRTEGCTESAMHQAAKWGYLDIVKFLHINRTEGCKKNTLETAANNVQFDTFRYLYENRKDLVSRDFMMDHFAKYKDETALQWFKDNTTHKCSEDAYRFAIESGNLSVLKWIHNNTTLPIPPNALDDAATCSNSRLSIVKYLHENGATATTYAMDYSLKLEILSFLHFNRTEGCTKEAMENAINKERLPIIKFLEKNRTEHLEGDYKSCTKATLDYLSGIKLVKKFNL